jgi:hypothetical protein
MAWADVDNDGIRYGDCWYRMPVKIFINDHGTFSDHERFGTSNTEGWWHTIVSKDLNGDGKMDFILGNLGLNSHFKASASKPVTMHINDFDLNGSVEQIICTWNGEKSFPVAMKDDLVKQIPSLSVKFKKFDDYKDATVEDIFSLEVLKRAVKLNANVMESCLMINTGNGSFHLVPLPLEAQFSPVYAIIADDFDHDGICDIIIGGNQYRAKPETGIYDASYGLFLKGDSAGRWHSVSSLKSGLFTKGEIRDLIILNIKGSRIIAVARNNDNLQFYEF